MTPAPRYTIITATLLRHDLKRLCDSIDSQTFAGWQHLIVVDERSWAESASMLSSIRHPQRDSALHIRAHGPVWDHVNETRHAAWDGAVGDYLLYIDDDNYLADNHILETLCYVSGPVALFPLEYKGVIQSPEPIQVGRSDVNGLMVRRDLGRFPREGGRSADGEFIVALAREHPCEIYRERALVVYEREGFGVA